MRLAWVIGVGCLALLGGCEEDAPPLPEILPEAGVVSEPNPQQVELPSEAAPVEAGAIAIDEQIFLLPPAVLVVEPIHTGLRLQLTGSENADDQTGNTLLLDMQTPAESVGELPEHPWIFRTTDDAWTDTPQGLTIEEEGWVLRPYSVMVEFAPDGPELAVMTLRLSGVFLLFDLTDPPDAPGRRVEVNGQFPAGVVGRQP